MNATITAYTPLESLLLFQSLATYGVEPSVFNKISDLLKNNPHIRSEKQYDSGRLSPDALRELYFSLLKDEEKREVNGSGSHDHDALNGDGQPNSRKRKAPSPSLPSVYEAAQHAHLIPKLVARLYSRYRSCVTDEIRKEERKYDRLQQELHEIEQGEWDERLQRQDGPNGKEHISVTNGSSVDETSTEAQEAGTTTTVKERSKDVPVKGSSQSEESQTEDQKASTPVPTDIEPVSNPPSQVLTNGQQPVSVPVQTENAPTIPHQPIPPIQSSNLSQLPVPQPLTPKLPHQQLVGSEFRTSPSLHQSPYAPHPPEPAGPSPTQASPSNSAAAPSSPMVLTHTAATQPTSPYSDANSQQNRGLPTAPQSHSPTQQHAAPSQPITQTNAAAAAAAQQTQAQHVKNIYSQHPAGTSPYPPNHPSMSPPHFYPPHRGGYMLPPFQVTPQAPQDATKPQPQQTVPQQPQTPTPTSTRPPPASTKSAASVPVRPLAAAFSNAHPHSAQPKKSISTPLATRTPRRPLLSLQTPRSDTRWKASTIRAPPSPQRSPTVSPIDDVGPIQKFPESSTASIESPAPKTKGRRSGQAKDTTQKTLVPVDIGSGEQLKNIPRTRGRRGVSVASSVVGSSAAGRTRSQSIASHAEGLPAETETPVTSQVKTEPSTPAALADEDDTAVEATPATTTQGRRRPGKVPIQSNKRKRGARDTSEIADSEEARSTPSPRIIVAPRHFSRMCNPIMNDILSHKHASLFSHPVKEKDAEGYKDIIRRPQDLKSIRMAISSGAKAVSAAASADTPAGSPGGAGGNVTLPLTIDVIPPKAIINSAQLERELMRMFANAVMFNPGEEGVVKDAREMFETVQESVSNWRSAERTTEAKRSRIEEDIDELAGDDELPSSSKRRKM